MMAAIIIYAISLASALLCDALWLGLIARQFYRKQLGPLMCDQIVWAPAFAFYLLHAAGVVYFCTLPAIQSQSIARLALSSVLFGLITYGTYDLTNWATLRNWPAIVSLVDMLWGASLSLIVGLIGYGAASLFFDAH
jgi:uncharacterized membrane protein